MSTSASRNTVFPYSYRDAAGYAQHERLVLAGELSAWHKEDIARRLDSGEMFIPGQVGLPELQGRFSGLDNDDHVWHALCPAEIKLTGEAPTRGAPSATELYRRLMAVREWDVIGAMRRIGLDAGL